MEHIINRLVFVFAILSITIGCTMRHRYDQLPPLEGSEEDSIQIKYSNLVLNDQNGDYCISIDHDRTPMDVFIKNTRLDSVILFDGKIIDSLFNLIYDRADYDTLLFRTSTSVTLGNNLVINIPNEYENFVDCVIAVLIYSSSRIDTLAISDNSRVQLNNLAFKDDRVYEYIAQLIAQNDKVWSKANEILYYDGKYHHYGEALIHNNQFPQPPDESCVNLK